MPDIHVEPLSGWPKARAFKMPDGLPAYRITPNVLTPLRARLADGCVELALAALALVGLGIFVQYGTWNFDGLLLALWLLAGFMAADEALKRFVPPLFRKRHKIVMTTLKVGVKRGWRWVWFSRLVDHRFALRAHDKALLEARKNEAERAAAGLGRKVPDPAFYYADSFHVALEQAGQRRDLLVVHGPQEAEAIIARLQYIDGELDAAIKMGSGASGDPAGDWHDAPGGGL